MPRILISISKNDLETISAYCANALIPRSKFMVIAALEKINPSIAKSAVQEPSNLQQIIEGKASPCDMDFCKSLSQGEYLVKRYNKESGNTSETQMNLCSKHHQQAKREEVLT